MSHFPRPDSITNELPPQSQSPSLPEPLPIKKSEDPPWVSSTTACALVAIGAWMCMLGGAIDAKTGYSVVVVLAYSSSALLAAGGFLCALANDLWIRERKKRP